MLVFNLNLLKKIIVSNLLFLLSTSFAAEYSVFIRGHEAGYISLNYKINDNNYNIKAITYPNSVAKLFGAEQLIEVVYGDIKDNFFYPKEFIRTNQKKHKKLDINFKSKQIIHEDDEVINYKEELSQDYLTQIFQIGYDLQFNHIKDKYYLITKNKVRTYNSYRNKKDITLKQEGGKRVIKLVYNKSNQLSELISSKANNELLHLKIIDK